MVMKEGFRQAARLRENQNPERQAAIEQVKQILASADVKDPEPAKSVALGAVRLTLQGAKNAEIFFEGRAGGLPGSGSNRERDSDQD